MLQNLTNLTTLFQIIKIHKPPHNFAPFIAKKKRTHQKTKHKNSQNRLPQNHMNFNIVLQILMQKPSWTSWLLLQITKTQPFFSIEGITYSHASCKLLFKFSANFFWMKPCTPNVGLWPMQTKCLSPLPLHAIFIRITCNLTKTKTQPNSQSKIGFSHVILSFSKIPLHILPKLRVQILNIEYFINNFNI
jgi:hypothetical protein